MKFIRKTKSAKLRANYIKLAEKMYFSIKRKINRNEEFRGSFEANLLTVLLPMIKGTGLEEKIKKLDYFAIFN